jgi:hypothetical protein
MPIIRGPNKPGQDPEQTKRINVATDPYAEKTVIAGRNAERDVARTSVMPPAGEDERTRIVGARKAAGAPAAKDFLEDPVVGWLVIIEGPGKGMSLKVGYGQNSIGRAPNQRIRLDFGDDQISREDHAFIVYDPKGHKFYVRNGSSANLTYVGDIPVLAPVELLETADLTIGGTILRFVPFCGPHFDWQEAVAAP